MLHGEDGFCNLREACACLPACHPRGVARHDCLVLQAGRSGRWELRAQRRGVLAVRPVLRAAPRQASLRLRTASASPAAGTGPAASLCASERSGGPPDGSAGCPGASPGQTPACPSCAHARPAPRAACGTARAKARQEPCALSSSPLPPSPWPGKRRRRHPPPCLEGCHDKKPMPCAPPAASRDRQRS